VAATHSPRRAPAPLRTIRVADADELRLLTFGAGVALLARSAAGGFPIKLLNYMEASRAIVARASVADPLEHERSGWVLDDAAPPAAWVAAVNTLLADPARAARLGAEAHRTLERAHAPAAMARALLAVIESLRANRATPTGTW
jgi:glycosyltransferase involved in cell wall biosynthesis